jgi:hypothetical protein
MRKDEGGGRREGEGRYLAKILPTGVLSKKDTGVLIIAAKPSWWITNADRTQKRKYIAKYPRRAIDADTLNTE